MPIQPQHIGLFFSDEHIQLAREHQDQEPIVSAIRFLKHTRSDNPLATAQLAGLRYRFFETEADAHIALELLEHVAPIEGKLPLLETIKSLLCWLSVIETVRLYPSWGDLQVSWFEHLRKQLLIVERAFNDAPLLEQFWIGALNIGAGIVLEDETLFQRGANIYRKAIAHHIHPEGYLKGIVDVEDVTETYRLQVSGTGALVLMAEMAEQVGIDLWSVNNRGVTPITATTYLHYYYYYPEKWKWEEGLTPEITDSIIRTRGAFIEMVNRRSPLRGIEILLEDQRPLFGAYHGGLTSLTHGISPPTRKKRWRLFG